MNLKSKIFNVDFGEGEQLDGRMGSPFPSNVKNFYADGGLARKKRRKTAATSRIEYKISSK
jgi:hypothetical protein